MECAVYTFPKTIYSAQKQAAYNCSKQQLRGYAPTHILGQKEQGVCVYQIESSPAHLDSKQAFLLLSHILLSIS